VLSDHIRDSIIMSLRMKYESIDFRFDRGPAFDDATGRNLVRIAFVIQALRREFGDPTWQRRPAGARKGGNPLEHAMAADREFIERALDRAPQVGQRDSHTPPTAGAGPMKWSKQSGRTRRRKVRVVGMVLGEQIVTRILGDLNTIEEIGAYVTDLRKYLSDPTWGVKWR
jgi:hypothetical protein